MQPTYWFKWIGCLVLATVLFTGCATPGTNGAANTVASPQFQTFLKTAAMITVAAVAAADPKLGITPDEINAFETAIASGNGINYSSLCELGAIVLASPQVMGKIKPSTMHIMQATLNAACRSLANQTTGSLAVHP